MSTMGSESSTTSSVAILRVWGTLLRRSWWVFMSIARRDSVVPVTASYGEEEDEAQGGTGSSCLSGSLVTSGTSTNATASGGGLPA